MVRGCGPSSLHPSPARSYEQTRANLATMGCTRLHSTEKSPIPASRITVGPAGRASPVQFRWRRHPPMSTRRPGAGRGGAEGSWARADAVENIKPAAASRTKDRGRRRVRLIAKLPDQPADHGSEREAAAPESEIRLGVAGREPRIAVLDEVGDHRAGDHPRRRAD